MDPRKRSKSAANIALEVRTAALGLKGRGLTSHSGPAVGAQVGLRWPRLDPETRFVIPLGCAGLSNDSVPGGKRTPEGAKEGHLASHHNAIDH